jgi:hypothetical protein
MLAGPYAGTIPVAGFYWTTSWYWRYYLIYWYLIKRLHDSMFDDPTLGF